MELSVLVPLCGVTAAIVVIDLQIKTTVHVLPCVGIDS